MIVVMMMMMIIKENRRYVLISEKKVLPRTIVKIVIARWIINFLTKLNYVDEFFLQQKLEILSKFVKDPNKNCKHSDKICKKFGQKLQKS